MKRILKNTGIALTLLSVQASFAGSGLFFNVSSNNMTLTIKTTIPNHTYANAGIKINTPGYTLPGMGTECVKNATGYCLFSVSDTQPKNITVAGSNGKLSVALCLDGKGPLSCQNYNDITVQGNARFAYITNDSGSPAVSLCSLNPSTGAIVACQDAGGGNVIAGQDLQGVVINNIGTTAFLTNMTPSHDVYQCTINPSDGTFTSCSSTTITAPSGYVGLYGMLTLNQSNTLAYIVDNHSSGSPRILACPIVGNVISATCVDTGATNFSSSASEITLNNSGTTAYIANYNQSKITVCSVNGTTFSNCDNVTGGGVYSFAGPGGVVLNNSGNTLYVADYSGNTIYGCTPDFNNVTHKFSNCFIASTMVINPWGITFNKANSVAYVTDYNDHTYSCSILPNGTFSTCTGHVAAQYPVDVALGY